MQSGSHDYRIYEAALSILIHEPLISTAYAGNKSYKLGLNKFHSLWVYQITQRERPPANLAPTSVDSTNGKVYCATHPTPVLKFLQNIST
jgi:hypothetical protein